jgi:hypothetical protein
MAVHVLLFVFVFFLLSLALLWRLGWLHLKTSSSRGGAIHSTVQRLLKPRTPADCPACRLASTPSSGGRPAPAPVRPWREVKSRRGAPKRVNTEGFACPYQQCSYFGITDAHIHAAFWRWQAWPSRAHPDVSRPCLSYHLHFQAQHPLVSSENSISCRVAVVLSALAEGLDPSAAERVFGFRPDAGGRAFAGDYTAALSRML